MTTPTPPASPAEANRPTATLPWQDASHELLSQNLGPASTEEVVRRACEQWALFATEHWRQYAAHLHDALARNDSQCAALQEQLYLCRTVLEECRPMVKAHLLEMERFGPGDESIVGRIEQALKVGL